MKLKQKKSHGGFGMLRRVILIIRENQDQQEQKPSQQIEVTDIKNNTTTTYNSMREAAIALNIKQSTITLYFFFLFKIHRNHIKVSILLKSYNFLIYKIDFV